MTKRPLCMMCLCFLLIRGSLLLFSSGDGFVKIPASSIFLEYKTENNIQVQGEVYKKKNTSKNQILYLKNNSILKQNKSYYDSKIIIYDDSFATVSIGQTLKVKGAINRFEPARNPGNFDQSIYYARENIYGYLWCEEILSVSGKENKYLEWLHQIKSMWQQTILNNMSDKNGPILCAMLLGERSGIEQDTKEIYQKNGISHVLAISGLHISFIGLGIYHVFRKCGVSYLAAGILAIGVLTLYVTMIGFSISVLRAYIMLLFRIGADITGRVYDLLTALSFSAVVSIIKEPLCFTDAAFYMSYGAILGIVLVYPVWKKLLGEERKWLRGVGVSFIINVTLFPILLWFYFEVATYSSVINMLILPLMTWVLGFGIFGSLIGMVFPQIGGVVLKGSDFLLHLFEWVGKMGCKLPGARMVLGKPEWWQVIVYYSLLLLFVWRLHYRFACRRITKERINFCFFCVVALFLFFEFPNDKLEVTMLDVGQGDCIYMKGPKGKSYLIDGGSSDVKEVGKYRMESFLKSQGIGKLDYVFVSHGDMDHYCGIAELLERQQIGVRIESIVFPKYYEEDEELRELALLAYANGCNVKVIDARQKMVEGDLTIYCVQPDSEMKRLEGNEGSMVLDVSFRNFNMLCCGDVENEGEERVIKEIENHTYDVLKVSHHGSKNSTTEKFLEESAPRVGLISVGENNSYGHPHEETLERLKKNGCKIYQTKNRGAITIETDGDMIDIFPSCI